MAVKEVFKEMAYGPAPESRQFVDEWLEKYNRKFKLFIDNQWQDPGSGEYFESIAPSSKEVLAEIASGTREDVRKAVLSAKKAQPLWEKIGGHARARYIYAMARQIQKNSRFFAVLESLDNGKPIRESRDIDIPVVARHLYYHAGWAQLMEEKFSDYKAVGVVGGIVPWNFPLMLFIWKVAPALAMGNTIVIKPARLTCLTALAFAEMCKEIGLPPGVLNIVTGSGSVVGNALVEDPDVNKISFTGSTEVGKVLRRQLAGTGKRLTLELGGKSPFIVFADCDIDSAIEGIVNAIWFNQGQVCCAGSRLLVQEGIEDEFLEKLKKRMETLRVGHSLDKSIDIGAIVDKSQLDVIKKYIDIGKEEGAEIWQPSSELPDTGFYYKPTVCTNVSPSSTIVQEEIFGPVLVSLSFRTPEEAVALANNTRYGLAASLWTEDINLALDIAPKIHAGTVWVNCTNQFDAAAGFGGYKESGFGREGGKEGLWDFLSPKWEKNYSKKQVYYVEKKISKDGEEEGRERKKKDEVTGSIEIDRTPKMYIDGKQVRPDGGYSLRIYDKDGERFGEVGRGNRKDIRNAVQAADQVTDWYKKSGHERAQVIYYIAENLYLRIDEIAKSIIRLTGRSEKDAYAEVEKAIDTIYTYAAIADKYDGQVHSTLSSQITLAMPERIGTAAVVCPDEFPLLAFVSLVFPLIALGNTVVVIPSEKYPFPIVDLYQVFDTSDLPNGVINIVTGRREELIKTLAGHDSIEVIWYFGADSGEIYKEIELLATENMKRTWSDNGMHRNWMDNKQGANEEYLRKSVEIKNIWIPYGY